MDAEKRTLIRVLPHTLVLHLKRFEWDYETYQRWKVGLQAGRCTAPNLHAARRLHRLFPVACFLMTCMPWHPLTRSTQTLQLA